jgi:hypothetical protein
MALFTSTPKSKAGEKMSLLALNCSDDDNSSGYDSPVYINDEKCNDRQCKILVESADIMNDCDSDFSSDDDEGSKNGDSSSSDDDDYLDAIDDVELANDSMKVISTKTLIDNIRYVLSMSDLCDITFLVGPQRIPVHGLKSILGTRSRAFLSMFLKQSKEEMNGRKKLRKKNKSTSTESSNKTTIIIDSYDVDVFRSFIIFLHCGSVTMDASTVTGLLCCATEFDIPDLNSACYEFIDKCASSVNAAIVIKETFRYGDHSVAEILRKRVLDKQKKSHLNGKDTVGRREHAVGKETEV